MVSPSSRDPTVLWSCTIPTYIRAGVSMKTASVRVRRGDSPDAASLAAFAAKTFADTFGPANRPEDMVIHLANSYGVEQQARELADPDYITVLVDVGDCLAAYAQVRR